jgi:hypothetical protein
MADISFQFDNKGRVPCDVKKTFGEITVLRILEPTQVFDDEQKPTGEIAERPVECFSSVVDGSILVDFAAEVNLEGVEPFTEIELHEDFVDVVPWGEIIPNGQNEFVQVNAKIKATKFTKVGTVSNTKQKAVADDSTNDKNKK